MLLGHSGTLVSPNCTTFALDKIAPRAVATARRRRRAVGAGTRRTGPKRDGVAALNENLNHKSGSDKPGVKVRLDHNLEGWRVHGWFGEDSSDLAAFKLKL